MNGEGGRGSTLGKEEAVDASYPHNNLEKALKRLKRKLERAGLFKEMKRRRHFEKPSERKRRKRQEAERRRRKKLRKEASRA